MYAQETKRLLRSVSGSLLEDDHVILRSGLHAATYVNCRPILKGRPDLANRLAELLARACDHLRVDVVAGPDTGGWILAQFLARHLGVRPVRLVKRGDGSLNLAPGDRAHVGDLSRVLVVDDVATTSTGTLFRTVGQLRKQGADAVAAAVVWNRGITRADLDIRDLVALVAEEIPAYAGGPRTCPMCAAGKTVNEEVGHPDLWLDGMIRSDPVHAMSSDRHE